MAIQIQFRRDTSVNWTNVNPILAEGELGLETDTKLYKIGDGINNWTALNYTPLTGSFSSMLLETTTTPASPSDGLIIYSENIAGEIQPKIINSNGVNSILQESFLSNGIIMALPGASNSLSYIGQGSFSAVGTIANPALTTSSLRESTRRVTVTSATTANSTSELRQGLAQMFRGGVEGLGGFYVSMTFGISSIIPTQRLAVGIWASTVATSASTEPSTIFNGVWVGNDLGDTNLQLMHNNNVGTATKIDLGSNFVKNQQNAIYELSLFCKSNDDKIQYRVKRLDSTGEVSGAITTNIPLHSSFLTPHYYANNGGETGAVVLDFYKYYLKTNL